MRTKGGKNNPGFIRATNINWLGETKGNYIFENFNTVDKGIRAWLKNAVTHYDRGKNTIEKLITTLSPPNENNTTSYVANVSRKTGIGRVEIFSKNQLPLIADAVFQIEGNKDTEEYNLNLIKKIYENNL